MLVKKFIADNYAEALARVKKELGPEALVLTTRSIKYRADRDAAAPASCVEITAALEREPVAASPGPEPPSEKSPWEGDSSAPAGWDRLQPLLNSLLSQTDRARSAGLKPEQMDLFGTLLRAGVEERFALRLFEMANRREGGADRGLPDARCLKRLMKRMVRCQGPIHVTGSGTRVVALVGPTGAGKTTTLAKLAAGFALGQNKRVAMISLDSFRMGALEQLRAYGDLMGVPVEAAQGRLDFRKLVHLHRDKQVILVDTTGKNHQDRQHVQELKAVFQSVPGVEIHLVHSVTTQERVIRESFERFAPLRPSAMVFTKLDEGISFGTLFNCAIRHRLPFSYFTTGQKVPEDIEVAAPERVIRLIFA